MILEQRQQATGNRQQATGNRQQATGNRQQATGNRQQATGNYLLLINNRVKPPWGLEPNWNRFYSSPYGDNGLQQSNSLYFPSFSIFSSNV